MAKTVNFRISVQDAIGNVSVFETTALVNEPPVITSVIIDPPSVPVGSHARVTILAHDPENDPLAYEIAVSEGGHRAHRRAQRLHLAGSLAAEHGQECGPRRRSEEPP